MRPHRRGEQRRRGGQRDAGPARAAVRSQPVHQRVLRAIGCRRVVRRRRLERARRRRQRRSPNGSRTRWSGFERRHPCTRGRKGGASGRRDTARRSRASRGGSHGRRGSTSRGFGQRSRRSPLAAAKMSACSDLDVLEQFGEDAPRLPRGRAVIQKSAPQKARDRVASASAMTARATAVAARSRYRSREQPKMAGFRTSSVRSARTHREAAPTPRPRGAPAAIGHVEIIARDCVQHGRSCCARDGCVRGV